MIGASGVAAAARSTATNVRRSLVVPDEREQLLELVDDDDQPAAGRDRVAGELGDPRTDRRRAGRAPRTRDRPTTGASAAASSTIGRAPGASDHDRPGSGAGTRAGAERRDDARPYQRRLAAARRADDRDEP